MLHACSLPCLCLLAFPPSFRVHCGTVCSQRIIGLRSDCPRLPLSPTAQCSLAAQCATVVLPWRCVLCRRQSLSPTLFAMPCGSVVRQCHCSSCDWRRSASWLTHHHLPCMLFAPQRRSVVLRPRVPLPSTPRQAHSEFTWQDRTASATTSVSSHGS